MHKCPFASIHKAALWIPIGFNGNPYPDPTGGKFATGVKGAKTNADPDSGQTLCHKSLFGT